MAVVIDILPGNEVRQGNETSSHFVLTLHFSLLFILLKGFDFEGSSF